MLLYLGVVPSEQSHQMIGSNASLKWTHKSMAKDRFIVALLLIPSVVAFALWLENRELNIALGQVDIGYIEFLNTRTKDGRRMSDMLKPGSVGVFKVGDEKAACGLLKAH